jgi:acyl-CoA dehydrogenase
VSADRIRDAAPHLPAETHPIMPHVAAAKSERNDLHPSSFGAAAKCFVSHGVMEITTDAVQLLDGAGYVKDYPAARMMRGAKTTHIYEVTNQIQRIVMARHLLRDPAARA